MKRALLLCVFLISMSGCQKYYIMETFQQDGQLFFKSSEVSEKCNANIYVISFDLEHIDENESRVAWRLARKGRMDYSGMAQGFPIKYGENLSGLQVHVAPIEILSGKYRIGAQVACQSEGDIKSMLLFGKFTIDSNKNLVIDRDHSNN